MSYLKHPELYDLHASYTRKVSDGAYGNIMYSVSIDKQICATSVQDAGQFAGTILAEAEKQVLGAMKLGAMDGAVPGAVQDVPNSGGCGAHGFVSGEAPAEVQAEIDELAHPTEPVPQPPADPVTPPAPEPVKPPAPAAPVTMPVRRSLGEGGNVDQPKRVVKRDDPASKPQLKLWSDLAERYAKATTGLILEDAFDTLKGKSFANTVKSKGEASDYITPALKIVADAEAKAKTPAPAKPVTPALAKPATQVPAKPAQNGGLSTVSPRAAEFLGDMVSELAEHWNSDVKAHEFLEATIKDKNKGQLVEITALSSYVASKVIDVFKAKIAEARRNKVAATVSTGPGF